MSGLREAAQQALGACSELVGWQSCCPEAMRDAAEDALDALRHALYEPAAEAQPVAWPIAHLTIDDSGLVQRAGLYAPGLPAGDHDVWLHPSRPTPPRLMDAEIDRLESVCGGRELIRAIESAVRQQFGVEP